MKKLACNRFSQEMYISKNLHEKRQQRLTDKYSSQQY